MNAQTRRWVVGRQNEIYHYETFDPLANRFSNLWIATGHAMMGLSLAPITGKLLAQSLVGEEPSIALDLVSPDRYAG